MEHLGGQEVGCFTWNTASGPTLVGGPVWAAARSMAAQRSPRSSGGSLMATIPPSTTHGVDRRIVVSGEPNPRQVTTSTDR